MTKDTNSLLTSRELCNKLKIHGHTLEKMVKAGLPVAGRKATRGRGSWTFDADAVARWAVAHGRDIPAIAVEEIKQAVGAHKTPVHAPNPPGDADEEPIALQLQAERSQYQKLFARFCAHMPVMMQPELPRYQKQSR